MTSKAKVVAAAQRLGAEKDEVALEVLLGKRDRAMRLRPELETDPDFDPAYDSKLMGPLDDIRALGRRILNRWNKECYGLVCQSKGDNQDREAILKSLNLGEAAVIGAIAAALLGLGVPAAIAAAAAPLIVKRFVWPGKDELCAFWGESIDKQS